MQIKVVLFEPLFLLLILEVFAQPRILHIDPSIAHHVNQTQNEGALTHRIGEGFDKIPPEPLNLENAVVTGKELGREEACHPQEHHV